MKTENKEQKEYASHDLLPINSCLKLIELAENFWSKLDPEQLEVKVFGVNNPQAVEVFRLQGRDNFILDTKRHASQIANHLIHKAIPDDVFPPTVQRNIVEKNSKNLINSLRRRTTYERNVAINYAFNEEENAYIQYFSFNLNDGKRVGIRVMQFR